MVNISFFVSPLILEPWLEVVRCKLLPSLEGHGFRRSVFSRVLSDGEEAVYSLLVEMADADGYEILKRVMEYYRQQTAHLPTDAAVWHPTLMEIQTEITK